MAISTHLAASAAVLREAGHTDAAQLLESRSRREQASAHLEAFLILLLVDFANDLSDRSFECSLEATLNGLRAIAGMSWPIEAALTAAHRLATESGASPEFLAWVDTLPAVVQDADALLEAVEEERGVA